MQTTKISVIGSGNMGGAMLRGWARANAEGLASLHLTATAKTPAKLELLRAEWPEVATTLSNTAAVAEADVVVLAVKPWFVPDVVREIKPVLDARVAKPVVISVVANLDNAALRELFGPAIPAVYAMPNIAAAYGESMTFVEEAAGTPNSETAASATETANTKTAASATETAASLLRLLGEVRVVPARLMAPGMMMAGCGIAYVMRYVRAMMEGGVEMGFYPHDARDIALQTMAGAVSLLRSTGLHPEAAIDKVTTPGGITIKGLNALDHAGFNSAVIRSLKAGMEK